ncbi:MAG: UvrD-helicase domain-containing protein [Bacteroidales bacterium]|nr:UvrD-helicase domain-containing protein [Bacteroidales bacterium]
MQKEEKEILEGLNPAQEDAVRNTEGPALIIAGAGSGKTRVLTCRIAWLLAHGVKPNEVMALTFTKKAAGEMKSRIAELVGERKARWICMGTFHSVFVRFLREFADRLGYPGQFTIYDQSDSKSAIKLCIKELQLDEKTYKPGFLQSRISLAKNNLYTVAGYRNDAQLMEEDRAARRGRTIDVYARYAEKCKQAGAMDFDDILLNMNILLKNHPDAREAIAARFRYILVDEYQDTNFAQYLIIKRLAEAHKNICVVGDDSQSIYSFRGARIENILRFRKDYPEARLFRLEQNYRSTQNIVNAANSVIAHNTNRIPKECFSKAENGEKVQLIKAFTEQEEAYLTASSIVERIYRDKAPYSSFAILYRTNAQSRAFEENLRRKNLPYRIYGGHSFYDRAEVKDMLAYFRLVVNPQDDEAFRRVINVPARGIGDTSMERLSLLAGNKKCSLFEAASATPDEMATAGLREATAAKFRAFAGMLAPFISQSRAEEAFTLAARIGDACGYVMAVRTDKTPEGQARAENVEELFNSIKEYSEEEAEMRRELADDVQGEGMEIVTLSDFLENIALLSEVEKDDLVDGEENTNKITLMTIHAAKGLEFPYVYVAGMEEGLFPSDSLNNTAAEIEEERRLFYVALTRAEKVATVSYAKSRMQWGHTDTHTVSRFVKEIDRRYLEGTPDSEDSPFGNWGSSQPRYTAQNSWQRPSRPQYQSQPQRPAAPQPVARPAFTRPTRLPSANFQADAIADLRPGQRVEHDRFGYGEILRFEDNGPQMKAIVRFDEGGDKTLLLKFAKLRIVKP